MEESISIMEEKVLNKKLMPFQSEQKIIELERRIALLEQKKNLTFPIDPITTNIIKNSAGVISTFLGLTDTPDAFENGKYLRSTGSAVELGTPVCEEIPLVANNFVKVNSAGTSLTMEQIKLKELSDTPTTYTANNYLKVDGTGTSITCNMPTFTELNDTPSTLTADQYLKANAGGTSLEFTALSAGIQNVAMGNVNNPPILDTGDDFAINVGFTPSILIFIGIQNVAGSTGQGHGTCFGFASGIASTQQYFLGQSINANNEVKSYSGSSNIYEHLTEGIAQYTLAVTAWDTHVTFELTEIGTYYSTDFLWLAFN